MANDRLYLRCKKCGEALCWYKWYPSGGYVKPVKPTDKDIEDFINYHILECIEVSDNLGNTSPFDLVNETEYDKISSRYEKRKEAERKKKGVIVNSEIPEPKESQREQFELGGLNGPGLILVFLATLFFLLKLLKVI